MSKVTPALVKKAMKEDLRESGIKTPTQLKKLKCTPLTPKQCEEITSLRLAAYEIPYFDARGRELKIFKRIKFLQPVPGEPGQKYWQRPDTLPHAYLPPVLPRNMSWSQVIKDPSIPIYITEGEKKAACACIKGLATIGIGGVWSFKSKKAGQSLIGELQKINWRKREVFIVFDNDIMIKPEVLRAMQTLTSTLRKQGASSVSSVYLGEDTEEKMGLDDFIVKYGIQAFKDQSTTSDEMLNRLHELNSRYAVIKEQGEKIFSMETQMFLASQGFVGVAEAPNRLEIIDSNNKPREVSVAAEWLRWSNRRSLERIVFEPGKEVITEKNEYNLWKGYPYQPMRGDISLFFELVDFIFKDAGEEAKEWFIKWAAYPLAKPGTKMQSAVLIWGDQGSGKSLLGLLIKNLYGEYGKAISFGSLTSDFNSWSAKAQFILADEVTWHGDRKEAAIIKNIITQQEVMINAKYQPEYTVNDYINYYLTSNYEDAVPMEKGDRRYLVVESRDKKPQTFYKKIDKIKNDHDFLSGLMYHLVKEIDLKNFDSNAAPPFTAHKEDMIHASMSSLDQVIDDAILNPDDFFCVAGAPIDRDVFTAEEVYHLLPEHLAKKTTITAVGHSLRRAGCPKRTINIKNRQGNYTTKRVYIVRNVDRLSKATYTKEIARNYEKSVTEIRPSNVVELKARRRQKLAKPRT